MDEMWSNIKPSITPKADLVFRELFESKDFRAEARRKAQEYIAVAVVEVLPTLVKPQIEKAQDGDTRAFDSLMEYAGIQKAKSALEISQTTIALTGSDLVSIIASLKNAPQAPLHTKEVSDIS
jgi:hypothetical protein